MGGGDIMGMIGGMGGGGDIMGMIGPMMRMANFGGVMAAAIGGIAGATEPVLSSSRTAARRAPTLIFCNLFRHP